jgi:hypothetical protein
MLEIYARTFRIATLAETPDARRWRAHRPADAGVLTRARRWLAARA